MTLRTGNDLTVWVCPECLQVHREVDGECMYECGSELIKTCCNCMAHFDLPLPLVEHARGCLAVQDMAQRPNTDTPEEGR
jgi:hypothetical protein